MNPRALVTRRIAVALRRAALVAALPGLWALPSLIGGSARAAAEPAAPPTVALYAAADGLPGRLAPLDPSSLADVGARPPLDLTGNVWSAVLSADGSTSAEIGYHDDAIGESTDAGAATARPGDGVTIVVRDGLGGRERRRIDLASYAVQLHLSRDGSRLVAMSYASQDSTDPPTFTLLDTASGRVLSTVREREDLGWQSWTDPDARRLYRLLVPSALEPDSANLGTGPWPVTLVATDLALGEEVGRLRPPNVLGGAWWTSKGEDDEGVWRGQEVRPAAALSPDGRRFVLLHADGDAMTVIDAERLAVERTLPLRRPLPAVDRLLGLLPLAPQEASAKQPLAGTDRQAVFAPDGRHLYVFGLRTDVAGDGRPTQRGLGLQVVDVDSGSIVAEALPGAAVDQVLPAPDGRDVYVGAASQIATSEGWISTSPYALYRLDPTTLDTRAERTFPDYRGLLLAPAVFVTAAG